MPAPVMVTVLPEIVAGPDLTLRVTSMPLLAVGAVIANDASPKVLLLMLAKVPIIWPALLIVLLVVAMVFSVAPVLVSVMLPL